MPRHLNLVGGPFCGHRVAYNGDYPDRWIMPVGAKFDRDGLPVKRPEAVYSHQGDGRYLYTGMRD